MQLASYCYTKSIIIYYFYEFLLFSKFWQECGNADFWLIEYSYIHRAGYKKGRCFRIIHGYCFFLYGSAAAKQLGSVRLYVGEFGRIYLLFKTAASSASNCRFSSINEYSNNYHVLPPFLLFCFYFHIYASLPMDVVILVSLPIKF